MPTYLLVGGSSRKAQGSESGSSSMLQALPRNYLGPWPQLVEQSDCPWAGRKGRWSPRHPEVFLLLSTFPRKALPYGFPDSCIFSLSP